MFGEARERDRVRGMGERKKWSIHCNVTDDES